MGKTYVTATLSRSSTSKDFTFLVDTGASYIGLPQGDIDELGLPSVPDGWVEVLTGTGVVRRQTYFATGRVLGQGFGAMVIEAPTPLVGYELLQNLRFRVNPVTEQLERVPADEIHPPFLL